MVGPTGIEPVPTASETIVLSIGLRAHDHHGGGGHPRPINPHLASIGFENSENHPQISRDFSVALW